MADKNENKLNLIIESSPHLRSPRNTTQIMYMVIALLLPITIAGVYFFGMAALVRILVSIAVAMITELIFLKVRKKDLSDVLDGSAIITGLLLALTLPPTIPISEVIIGSAIAIGIGKQVFGGLGYNIFNPALVGRAFLQAAFPVDMTTWVKPFFYKADSITAATPLGGFKFSEIVTPLKKLLMGNTGGTIGETSALIILIVGIILLLLKLADWRIPLSIIVTVVVFTEFLHLLGVKNLGNPLFYLFSGGLMLGAFFMATDMVSSPITPKGSVIFGVGIGIVVMIIRVFGGLPEGMMYSILFMNAFVPLINRYTKPRVFGEVKK